MRDARERAQRLGDRLVGEPGRTRGGGRGRGVLAVVARRAGPARPAAASSAANSTRRPPARHLAEPARHDRGVLRGSGSRRSAASRRGRPRTMPWRSRWSGSRLISTATRGRKLVDVLELEARELADDPGVWRRLDAARSPARRCPRRPPRARPRGTSRRATRWSSSFRSSRSRRGSGSAGSALRARPRSRSESRAAATSAFVARHAGALDQHVGAVEERDVLVVPELAVDADDLDAVPLEQRRRRLPRARHAEDDGALHRRRTRRSSGSSAFAEHLVDRVVRDRDHDAVADQPGDARIGVALLQLLQPVGRAGRPRSSARRRRARASASPTQVAVENEDRHPPRKNRK